MSPSAEQIKYLKNIKRQKIKVLLIQITITLSLLLTWEVLSQKEIINTFIFSSPSEIIKTLINLAQANNLFNHITITLLEVIIAFSLGGILGLIIAIILYSFPTVAKVCDPFLTLINSLPKVALGPILIIWIGANQNSIIAMALLINLIVSILTVYNGFVNTDKTKLKLFDTFKASKKQILFKLVIPANYSTIISSLKLNISMSLIGVIMGEFLVSKQGLGYLIMYGSQVFNLNLVMSSIFIILIISYLLYISINYLEKKLLKNKI